ncbi:hypothetical protein NBT05_02615 [Aquimarina sp. ERC-38]|uniref:hypothetical protein n=1 Tax=Aquimarina sp. ERC-38 TaxID=2949996 RepID=UPI002245828F|nr:hypothetical protein [Aquimarina sp. ERC-38]UZO81375.1 hypothetical protein NBT05_02615 [Aquimarina sp. ERC-38]
MSEEFALQYAKQRAKERGYDNYRIVYREFVIPANGTLKFEAYNEIWLITHITWGLIIKSDYGRYNHWYARGVIENAHEHGDQIEIVNTRKYQRTVRFLQVILKTATHDRSK